jgi:hypothetical protein
MRKTHFSLQISQKLTEKKWGHPGFDPGSPANTKMFFRELQVHPKQAYYHYTNDPKPLHSNQKRYVFRSMKAPVM